MAATDARRLRLGSAIFVPDTLMLVDTEGAPISMRRQSLLVLAELAARNGEVVDRDALIDAVWAGRSVSDDNLAQCIKDIRAALSDHDRRLLRTSIGRGYSLHGMRDMAHEAGDRPTLLISALRSPEGDPRLAELASTVSEELVIAVSPRAGLRVSTDATQRQSALYRLDGRVSRSGEDARVFVQLVRGDSGEVAFANTWAAPDNDTKDLPRQVADKIASVLRVHMFNHEGEAHIHRDNDDLTTQELLAKAAYHMSRIQMQNRDVARAALSLAIEREPENAVALAMRASTAVISILQEGYANLPDPPDYCLALADRAVGIGSHIDFVMLTRGCLRLWLKADHAGARADFERALAINPVFHLAHQFLATSEILSGDCASGVARMMRVIELGPPNNPRYPHYLALLALGTLLAGNVDEAVRLSLESHERAPGDPWCAYVHAATVADRDEISGRDDFRRMVAGIDLPITHFRDLPFTEPGKVEWLEDRLRRAGLQRLP